jgi:hypothetical protein
MNVANVSSADALKRDVCSRRGIGGNTLTSSKSKSHLEAFARQVMADIDDSLQDEFATLMVFLEDNPEFARTRRLKNPPAVGTNAHLTYEANRFAASRKPRFPKRPTTVADDAVSTILESYFSVDSVRLYEAKALHQLSMAAENLVGDLLERYISENVKEDGWIWCSGAAAKSIDFVRRGRGAGIAWESLQVKNRDNSENSSSAAIRHGTSIKKWHRSRSKTGKTEWALFPAETSVRLTEVGFLAFIGDYLEGHEG